jgi:secreted trypsin-like serine protease
VLKEDDGNYSNIRCGGSIISSKTILSAAHCTKRYGGGVNITKLYVVVGEHDTRYNDGEEYRKVCKSFEHPEYDYPNIPDLDYDYGILILCKHLTWSKEVSPVCLPDKESKYEGKNAIFSGWGILAKNGNQPVKLQKALFVVLTNEECRDVDLMTSRKLCAESRNQDKFICHKDSGGPLAVFDNVKKSYHIVGIASFTSSCGTDDNDPSGFARVPTVLDWIINNIRGSQCN